MPYVVCTYLDLIHIGEINFINLYEPLSVIILQVTTIAILSFMAITVFQDHSNKV